MIFNRFTFLVFVRLLLLAVSLALLLHIALKPGFLFTLIMLAVLAGWQFWALLRFLVQTNDELAMFFTGFQYRDATRSFDPGSLKKNFSNLGDALNKVSQQLKNIRMEKEAQSLLNQSVIDQMSTGIIAFNREGGVRFHNRAAANILGVEGFSRLDQLQNVRKDFSGMVQSLQPGKPRLVTLTRSGRELPVSIKVKELLVGQEGMYLLTLQEIKSEMDQKEVESWEKLIRVLTHEMMNNITPVITLSNNIEKCLGQMALSGNRYGEDQGNIDDALASARLIEDRSQGLMNFVNKYRSLTLMPEAELARVPIKPFLENQLAAFGGQFRERGILAKLDVSPGDLEVGMDVGLMAQAITNLLKNAVEALDKTREPVIRVSAFSERERPCIRISDNGVGIPPENMDAVFIPFFSTKEEGSGVGLSLCKQIMGLHQGSIEVESSAGKGTSFTMFF
ncbi:MAG: ATP-binding protein [Bacteroidales bacterium]